MITGVNGRYQPMIRDLPQGERPRERLKQHGAKHLSNTELIAILLRQVDPIIRTAVRLK